MKSDLDRLLEIAEARSYIGEEIVVNDDGKYEARQHDAVQAAYHYGRQARAYYKPIIDNPHVAMTPEWTKWREGFRSLIMPSPQRLEEMKAALELANGQADE